MKVSTGRRGKIVQKADDFLELTSSVMLTFTDLYLRGKNRHLV